jgi:dTDP-4-amino-4,6-dideoxygalactose transaminase
MIPLFKVAMSREAAHAVSRVLDSGFIGQGEYVDKFEHALAEILPMGAVTTNSCTSAIELVLTHLGVGPGDEVITSPLTCTASNAPIVHLGARPVWADVDSLTGNIDPYSISQLVTPRTRAIIAVDWTGRRADYWSIRQAAPGIPIIEDAAHGPLFKDGDQHGDFICSSYGPIKHLTAGDGGSVAHADAGVRAALRLLRWYGLDRTSGKDFRCAQNIVRPGMKWHMNDINAAIGLANLKDLPTIVHRHRENARRLHEGLRNSTSITLPPLDPDSNYWVFPILVAPLRRRALQTYLTERGIMSSQVHMRNDRHDGFNYPAGPLPGLDVYDSTHLNVPCGWWVGDPGIDEIVTALHEWKP